LSSLGSLSTCSSLIDRVKQRDAEAWKRFARLYAPLVYRWARQCDLQPSDAADVVQDVFTAVARSIDTFRHDEPGSSLRGWLWTIARNQVRLHYRRLKNRPEATGGSDANQQLHELPDLLTHDDEPSRSDSHASLVHRAVQLIRQDFQPQTWQAFWRVVVEEQAVSDVAQDLGITPAAVRQAKYRVLCRLQEELAAG
jgi:RNA polymerase sigma-70 factor (ECF subfamily)